MSKKTATPNPRQHVTPHESGWQSIRAGARRAAGVYATQAEAIAAARVTQTNRGGGEVTIHGSDGRIRDSDTVAPGNDPSPPKDKK
jgi:hypothetical protein